MHSGTCTLDLPEPLRRDFAPLPPVTIEKHKLLQILVNLISSARHAMVPMPPVQARKLTISVRRAGTERFAIEIKDSGVGISEENLAKLFQHGFTTRSDGHGFGLHASAIAAKQMDGSLSAVSAGLGTGATFSVELPIEAKQTREEELHAAATSVKAAPSPPRSP